MLVCTIYFRTEEVQNETATVRRRFADINMGDLLSFILAHSIVHQQTIHAICLILFSNSTHPRVLFVFVVPGDDD